MWSKPLRQKVGLAEGLVQTLDGPRLMDILLNIHAEENDKRQAVDQLRNALDSLILDLEY
ncbi:MAG: hypothetical protein ABIG32_03870 [Candidatus Uhrbacteria bacterium]|nr:hypothetical protein [Patescibacteria group bacterium]MBU1906548.1 hypothetical protein [Patescibacteria group bacterium]